MEREIELWCKRKMQEEKEQEIRKQKEEEERTRKYKEWKRRKDLDQMEYERNHPCETYARKYERCWDTDHW